jgi:hypothetical protein
MFELITFSEIVIGDYEFVATAYLIIDKF